MIDLRKNNTTIVKEKHTSQMKACHLFEDIPATYTAAKWRNALVNENIKEKVASQQKKFLPFFPYFEHFRMYCLLECQYKGVLGKDSRKEFNENNIQNRQNFLIS